MALPTAVPDRQLKHSRRIDVLQIRARGDGLWRVGAAISDTKARDEKFNVHEAGSQTRAMPYRGQCDNHGDAYIRLVGLNLLRGFRSAVREHIGGVLGCTHLTELAQIRPTAVVQAFAGDVLDAREESSPEQPPLQIDRCYALRADSAAVREFCPRWYQPRVATPSET